MKETQSFVRGENTFSSGTFCERSRRLFKLLVFYLMTLLVARDRNPTQIRLSTKGSLLAHSTQKHAKISYRKGEKDCRN